MVLKEHTHSQREGSDKSSCLSCWAENLVPVLREADRLLVPVSSGREDVQVTVLKIRQALFEIGRD